MLAFRFRVRCSYVLLLDGNNKEDHAFECTLLITICVTASFHSCYHQLCWVLPGNRHVFGELWVYLDCRCRLVGWRGAGGEWWGWRPRLIHDSKLGTFWRICGFLQVPSPTNTFHSILQRKVSFPWQDVYETGNSCGSQIWNLTGQLNTLFWHFGTKVGKTTPGMGLIGKHPKPSLSRRLLVCSCSHWCQNSEKGSWAQKKPYLRLT